MAIIDINLGFVANAAGTVDAITATFAPAPASLYDGLLLWFVATGANTITNPTFNPNALGAKTIFKNGGTALAVGDIPGALAVVNVEFNLANDRWEIVGFIPSGGLVITAQNGDYSAVANDLVVYDTNSADRTLTLPAAPLVDDRVGIYLQTLTGTDTVIIDRNGNTIGGVAANETLYIANDFLLLKYDGISDWIIDGTGLQPHRGKMTRDVAQSITINVTTQILHDNTEYNVGGIVDLANSKFTTRRAGEYLITSASAFTMTNATVLENYIFLGVVLTRIGTQRVGSTGNTNIETSYKITLASGVDVEHHVNQSSGTQNTQTSVQRKPEFTITELL